MNIFVMQYSLFDLFMVTSVRLYGGVLGYMVRSVELHGGEYWVTLWRVISYIVE